MSNIISLYHGTDIEAAKDICKNGIKLDIGSAKVDFGPGFYLTDNYDQAVKWAKRKARYRQSKAAVVTVMIDQSIADNIIEKFDDDLRWGRFIINNRNGYNYISHVAYKDHNLDQRYDITYGRIADLNVVDIADSLNESRKMLMDVDKILNTEYHYQYAIHTIQGLTAVVKRTYRTI